MDVDSRECTILCCFNGIDEEGDIQVFPASILMRVKILFSGDYEL